MSEKPLYIEVHLLQNFAPSNLNRDDTGNPKDCEFGGVRRARISSQCLKRAIRNAPVFAETTQVPSGERTKRFVGKLVSMLEKAGKPAEQAHPVVGKFIEDFASKLDSKDKDNNLTAVLLYFSPAELQGMVDLLLANWDDVTVADEKQCAVTIGKLSKELVKAYKTRTSAPDIALFGRMLAEKPELNIDAACQVAHALSTHRVTMEMDFYTAVDDLRPEDTAGSAMMGFTGFDSACFYRYARLDWGQLLKNLDGDVGLARRTVEAFLRAVEAIPTGKQNTFAAHNPPSFRLAVAREGGFAWSLANAFEKPVHPRGDSGLVTPSVAALETYWSEQLLGVYGKESTKQTATLAPGLELTALNETRVDNLESWIDAVMESLPKEA